MRFRCQFCGWVAVVMFLLGATTAHASTVALPVALYSVDTSTGFCAGINCSAPYSQQLTSDQPGTLQVGCSADVGAPNCAGALLLAAPAPFISVAVTTSLNHSTEDATAMASVLYSYQ